MNREHAIVIGGSMAGLLAARVLADHFERVTIVERDRLPGEPSPRKGVPQARHVHALLVRGRTILEQLFPGLEAELVAAGAIQLDVSADFLWLSPAGWGPRFPSGVVTVSLSRDLLEWSVRRRLAALGKARFVEECDAIDLLANADRSGVIGVRVQSRASADGAQDLPADFVVDASGRGSRAPKWLTGFGYPAPRETTVTAFLGYSSRWYKMRRDRQTDWKAILLQTQPPHMARGGIVVPVEGERWLVTLGGYARDYPPTDEPGFIDFARSLRSPAIHDAIKDAEPLTPIYGYQRTENRLLHYEGLSRWPGGFAVLGDAVCAFNPIYGQGMTTAAQGALALDRCLRQAQNGLSRAARRFQKQLARSNADAWLMATGEDFRYPTTEGGGRSWATRLIHRYMDQVLLLAAERPDVYATFVRVLHLIEPPRTMFRPGIAGRVATRVIGRRRINITDRA
jgi:flavin-dependent dehydrogenase